MAEEIANNFDSSSPNKEGSSVCPICLAAGCKASGVQIPIEKAISC